MSLAPPAAPLALPPEGVKLADWQSRIGGFLG